MIQDQLAYVATRWQGFVVFDIKDPDNIQQIVHVESDEADFAGLFRRNIRLIDIAGDLLALGAGSMGIVLLDVSVPERIKVLSSLELPTSGESFRGYSLYDLRLTGQQVVALAGHINRSGIEPGAAYIVDITEPRAPVLQGSGFCRIDRGRCSEMMAASSLHAVLSGS